MTTHNLTRRLPNPRNPQTLVGACIHCGHRDLCASLSGVCGRCTLKGKS